MSTAGLAREIDVSEVADEWGCSPEASLRELVDVAPPGAWADIFGSHLMALTSLTDEVGAAADTSQRLLRARLQNAPTSATPADPEQALDSATRDANYRLALTVTARVLKPTLAAFLR
jgi:hypothetical protein